MNLYLLKQPKLLLSLLIDFMIKLCLFKNDVQERDKGLFHFRLRSYSNLKRALYRLKQFLAINHLNTLLRVLNYIHIAIEHMDVKYDILFPFFGFLPIFLTPAGGPEFKIEGLNAPIFNNLPLGILL